MSSNVLGYKYSTLEDTLQIFGSSVDQLVKTKGGILSQTARVFDSLSCLPVTIRGKNAFERFVVSNAGMR